MRLRQKYNTSLARWGYVISEKCDRCGLELWETPQGTMRVCTGCGRKPQVPRDNAHLEELLEASIEQAKETHARG